MNPNTILRWFCSAAVFFAITLSSPAQDAQEPESDNSVTVPTPSFSNPGSEAATTEVPSAGTGVPEVDPLDLLNPLPDVEKGKLSKSPVSREELQSKLENENSEGGGESKSVEPEKKRSKGDGVAEQARIEMLEKLADQLSLRMRMLREREKALTLREQAIAEREQKAAQREAVIHQIEQSLLRREAVVRRREKLPPPQAWRGDAPPSVNARYATVLDGETMQFYFSKNGIEPTPVASTQKLMTALVICEAGDLDKEIVIPKEATLVDPTKIGVKTGERYTRRELLTALLVKSGNDIAAALAIDNAGSVDAFAVNMNDMGKRIGLVNSNFKTPHGLPAAGQYSCARDIGIVAFEAYQVPDIREITKLTSYQFVFNDGKTLPLSNTNRLLRAYEHCNGMKTGFTYAAGRCLVSSANVGNQHRIAVVIKTSNQSVWTDSRELLEWSLALKMLGPMSRAELAQSASF